jgi:phosphate transport system substrate-binding protein
LGTHRKKRLIHRSFEGSGKVNSKDRHSRTRGKIVIVLLLGLPLFLRVGSPFFGGEKITIKGSDTMVILGQRWAEQYMKKRGDIVIRVTAGGSGTGFSALINGTADICFASRPMNEEERERLRRRADSPGVAVRCAIDGLSLYVHPENAVDSLTIDEIRGVYTGGITNWKELGGKDAPIILYGREDNSGTYVYLKEEILKSESYDSSVIALPSTAAVVNAVSKGTNAVGYGGAAYSKGIRELAVRRHRSDTAYVPSLKHIQSGKYPMSRDLYVYLRETPEGVLKDFVDWILGVEGQAIVREVGYFPLR